MRQFAEKVAFLVVLFGCMVVFAIGAQKIDLLKAENISLKAEKVEWQRAAVPAMMARGWWEGPTVNFDYVDITPERLSFALNPCYTTPSGNVNHADAQCHVNSYFANTGKQASVPIEIVRAKSWP